MANAIPKWIQERLSRLWKTYNSEELTFEMIEKVLSPMDERNTISVFLNELKKAGWIDVNPGKEDPRKRVYILKAPNEVMMNIEKEK